MHSIKTWNVASVADMFDMFRDATSFDQDISSWDVTAVTSMQTMFKGASALSQQLCWDVSGKTITDMFLNTNSASVINCTIPPTGQPTCVPSGQPTNPTGQPTSQPTGQPTRQPTSQPTGQPTNQPTGPIVPLSDNVRSSVTTAFVGGNLALIAYAVVNYARN